jgi:hypothetical protein
MSFERIRGYIITNPNKSLICDLIIQQTNTSHNSLNTQSNKSPPRKIRSTKSTYISTSSSLYFLLNEHKHQIRPFLLYHFTTHEKSSTFVYCSKLVITNDTNNRHRVIFLEGVEYYLYIFTCTPKDVLNIICTPRTENILSGMGKTRRCKHTH